MFVRWVRWAPWVIVAAGAAAYSNSFGAPFLFDDFYHIVENPRIRLPAFPWSPLTGTARPLVALTLALNHLAGGLDVWGYHLFNLAVHLLAGLALFGLARRTFESPALAARTGARSAPLALAIALLWLLHPIQTQSVTYIIQRAESMMGLFYLLTLYGLARSAQTQGDRRWGGAAVLFCALGMLSKPVMVTAPLLALLYDRTFFSRSWKELWQRRRWLHAGLASGWILLALFLLAGAAEYQTEAGFHLKELSPLRYARVQAGTILHYLRITFWPDALLLDYSRPAAAALSGSLFSTAAVLFLLAGTVWLLRLRPAAGFLGAWFFLILAPTSSFLPILDPVFEHRMYLPLAAVVTAAVLLAEGKLKRPAAGFACAALALTLGTATWLRNGEYGDQALLWRQAALSNPENPRARNNLGAALQQQGKVEEAMAEYAQALRLDPEMAEARISLGFALMETDRMEEASASFAEALRRKPRHAKAHMGLGLLNEKQGRTAEAMEEYLQAVRWNPTLQDAHFHLGFLLQKQGQTEEAMAHYRSALKLGRRNAPVHNNIGLLLFQRGSWEEAIRWFRRAAELDPAFAEARNNWGAALQQTGDRQGAIFRYREALRLKPGYGAARDNLRAALSEPEGPKKISAPP